VTPHHTALRCLFIVAIHHGLHLTPEEIGSIGTDDLIKSVLRVMKGAKLKGRALHDCSWTNLMSLGGAYPAMVVRRDGTWMIVVDIVTDPEGVKSVAILDPLREQDGIFLMPQAEFMAIWSGSLILCKRVYDLDDENQPFGLRWFMPEILRHAKSFRSIAIAAILANLISYAIPLLFQVVVDKVITHHSYQTLLFVVLVFLVLLAFDGIFGYVRQNLMLYATNRIDARLVSKTFQHLLSLPLEFFESHTAGVLTRHMQQTEKLRQFLTGRLFQLILDTIVLPILLVMLAFYSLKLTIMVLVFSGLIALVIAGMVPTFRYQLDRLYQSEGERQSHLVETLHSMRAVKSLVLEGERQKSWDNKIAQAMRRHMAVGKISSLGNVLTHGLEHLMQITILALGAMDVFDGTLTLGSLIAFNMLSGRVSGPLVQIVALINEYQETALSVKMLGAVMNAKPERTPGMRQARPLIVGNLEFTSVNFTYHGASNPALRDISFKVEEGQMIGVVGRSGSGKTTITRLIQSIHMPDSGLIRLDGADLRHIDINHLRRSIGVVLQDNLLFRGTIRENIAAAKPDASLDEILRAARMAGADEFIERLPMSYDTMVEENASNFSGGQRQRVAIARALVTHPRLLIFDEATSALDPDSEAIVQNNLNDIAQGRTMIIVSHRLSSLVKSDRILVLERGQLIDFAPHNTLLERCDVYRHLWQQQTQHLH